METQPNFDDVEVTERPKNQSIEGTVESVIKATREELYDLEEDEEPRYGERDDERVQLEVLVEHKGHEFTIYEDMAFYENPSDRSMFGKFINRYGKPEKGQEVIVDFDHEGEGQVTGIRE